MRLTLLPFLLLCFSCASCRIVEDSSSAFAAQAGESTIVLGSSCEAEFNKGWGQCLIERGNGLPFPTLRFVMTNAGDYAVSDCGGGILKSGSVAKPGLVELELEGLRPITERQGFCILELETNEKFTDPKGGSLMRTLNMRGGFFIEAIQPGYFPIPSQPDIAFCTKVERTTKGRTKVTKCQASE